MHTYHGLSNFQNAISDECTYVILHFHIVGSLGPSSLHRSITSNSTCRLQMCLLSVGDKVGGYHDDTIV